MSRKRIDQLAREALDEQDNGEELDGLVGKSDRELLLLNTCDTRKLRRQVQLVTKLITGNGDPKKGLLSRVDRLEWWQRTVAVVVTCIFTPVLGAMGLALWRLVASAATGTPTP